MRLYTLNSNSQFRHSCYFLMPAGCEATFKKHIALVRNPKSLFIPEVSFLKQVYCLKFTLVERRPIQAKTKLPSQNTATTIITTHLPAISKNPSLQGMVEGLISSPWRPLAYSCTLECLPLLSGCVRYLQIQETKHRRYLVF